MELEPIVKEQIHFTNENIGGTYGAQKVIYKDSFWVYKSVRPRYEVAAYGIYKAILPYKRGYWYVPETFLSVEIDYANQYRNEWSLQAFVKDATPGHSMDYYTTHNFTMDSITAAEISAFDYLVNQGDRHNGNYLFDLAGQVVLIDHGNAFDGGGAYGCSKTFAKLAPKNYSFDYWNSARNNILNATPDQHHELIINRLNRLIVTAVKDL